MSRARPGFTLIEALVAIVLVAVVLPVALAGVSAALRSADQIRRHEVAMRVAQSRLAMLVADGSWQSAGTTGDCSEETDGEDTTGLRWQMSVSTWRDPVVRILRVTVSWGSTSEPHSVFLETLVTPPITASATGSTT